MLNVHEINKQDMQNNICIIAVKLHAQKVLLSHIFIRRDICATHQLRPSMMLLLCSKRCQTSIKRCFSSSTSWTC